MNELSDFGQTVHVLCLGSAENVQGLQWAFDQKVPSEKSYRVYRGGLSQDLSKFSSYDFIVLLLDMAQPVPVELVGQLAKTKKGLCAFIQPTPGQLLALNQASDWEAVAWDGVNLEDIAQRSAKRLERMDREIREKALFASVNDWMQAKSSVPGEIACIRAPSSWQGNFSAGLDPSTGVLSVGCRDSAADLKLPLPGGDELFELLYRDESWTLSPQVGQTAVNFDGDSSRVQVGDEIEVGGALFQIRRERSLQDLFEKSQKVFADLGEALDAQEASLEKFCRHILTDSLSGELTVKSGHRSGTIYFFSGVIMHALTGSVSGLKALLRILSWELEAQAVSQKFQRLDPVELPSGTMSLDLIRFSRATQANKEAIAEVSSLMPPPSLRLEINPRGFLDKEDWTNEEARILAAIGEFSLIRDVVNFCPLPDAQIFKTLVQLRRQKLISPARPMPA